ncbi:hypothetical protein FGU71_03680 [Erythrobacter insulae]|uniref:Uncharacterized protein n=1 Tax=Erythrobacter insulae TaxID=2584124 RepID=A0A547PA65_9SPHN|nr:hypothetical protein [Erythrobacter insulae]TRD11038.1 hypothetical protein FGU71_03680 [Erythrobacter insulae]
MDFLDQPPWLKIMQNGSVGEARTKAFLLDRFWVLERSVDIDGADFLVQPRSLGSRFTDRTPPNIGVVQAKYFQDTKTVHHIPRNYVLDEQGFALDGFFAVLHVGAIDEAKIFMLSAEQMKQTLDQTVEKSPRFVVGKKALADKFRVDQHRRQALDRIEHAITARTLTQSLHFYDRVNIPLYKITLDDIAYRYKLPIPNDQTDIAKTYLEYREHLKWLTYEIEEGLTIIDKIMQEPDPRVALVEREKLEEYRSGRTYRDGLTFATRKVDLDWPYLVEALDQHDTRIAALEAVGQLERFVDLSQAVKDEAIRLASDFDPGAVAEKYLWMRLNYNVKTLGFDRLSLTLKDAKPGSSTYRLNGSSHLNASKGNVDVVKAARGLWNLLMTKILFDICPALRDEED